MCVGVCKLCMCTRVCTCTYIPGKQKSNHLFSTKVQCGLKLHLFDIDSQGGFCLSQPLVSESHTGLSVLQEWRWGGDGGEGDKEGFSICELNYSIAHPKISVAVVESLKIL